MFLLYLKGWCLTKSIQKDCRPKATVFFIFIKTCETLRNHIDCYRGGTRWDRSKARTKGSTIFSYPSLNHATTMYLATLWCPRSLRRLIMWPWLWRKREEALHLLTSYHLGHLNMSKRIKKSDALVYLKSWKVKFDGCLPFAGCG